MTAERVEVRKVAAWVPVSSEQLEDTVAIPSFEELAAMYAAESPEERAARHARIEADRLARTCPECGCDGECGL